MTGSIEKPLMLAAFRAGLLPDMIASEFNLFDAEVYRCKLGCREDLDAYELLENLYFLVEDFRKAFKFMAEYEFVVNIAPWILDQIFTCDRLIAEISRFKYRFCKLLGSRSQIQFYNGIHKIGHQFCTGIAANLVRKIKKGASFPLDQADLACFRNLGKYLTDGKRSYWTAVFYRNLSSWLDCFTPQMNDLIKDCSIFLPELADNLHVLNFGKYIKYNNYSWQIKEIIDSIIEKLEDEYYQEQKTDKYYDISKVSKKMQLENATFDKDLPLFVKSKNGYINDEKQNNFSDSDIYLYGKVIEFERLLSKNILGLMVARYDSKKMFCIDDFAEIHPYWSKDELYIKEDESPLEKSEDKGKNSNHSKSALDLANGAVRTAICQLRTELAALLGLENSKKGDLINTIRDRSKSITYYCLNIELIKKIGMS